MAKSRQNKTRKNNRNRGRRNTGGMPGGVGDIPRAPKSDITTRSIALPKATSRLVFHQHAPPMTLSSSNLASVSSAITFALNGLNGASTPQALFDFYRIIAVRVEIRPQNTGIGVLNPAVDALVPLYCAIDYNDSAAPATAAIILEYDNCAVLSAGESLTRTFQPRMSSVVRSAAGTDYMSVKPQWLNTGSDDVIHYGLKIFIPQTNALQTNAQSWLVTQEYYIEFSKVV